MRSVPTNISQDHLEEVIEREWSLTGLLEYHPVGAGAFHWVRNARDGTRYFVTCDDLDTKPWLGPDRQAVLAGLMIAYRTVGAIGRSGADFVVPHLPARSGEPLVQLDARMTAAVSPFGSGTPGRWGAPADERRLRRVVQLLAELHRMGSVAGEAPSESLELPGRAEFEAALDGLRDRWDHGPLAERARRRLQPARALVLGWLDDLDRMTVSVSGVPKRVLTHGEPHPENFVWTATGPVLVDWDRVAMARPERDLWMLDDGSGPCSQLYRDLTGITPDPTAMRAYRLLWALTDLAAFTSELRRPHREDADTTRALDAIGSILSGREPAPYG